MRIVSDTGPIIGLAKIGMINLLRTFATEVLIPPFVSGLDDVLCPPTSVLRFSRVSCNDNRYTLRRAGDHGFMKRESGLSPVAPGGNFQ